MKKHLFLLLLTLFMFTLAACGGEEQTPESDQNTSEDVVADDTTTEPNDPEPEAGDETNSEQPNTQPEPEPQQPNVSVNLLIGNEVATSFSRGVAIQYDNIINRTESVRYSVQVNYEGTILFNDEFTLVVLPRTEEPYTNVATISYQPGELMITGLNQGWGFFVIEVYVGSERVLTSETLMITVD